MKEIENYIKTIPLYSSLYKDKIKTFNSDKDLNEYPILEKTHILNDFPNNWMTSKLQDGISNDLVETTTTSGTSGQRFQIFRKKGWWRDEYIRTYQWSSYLKDFRVGVSKKAILTTAICSNASCYLDFPTYEDRIMSNTNTLYLNLSADPNDWSKSDVLQMMSELNDFQPEYLDADPIYLALFLKKFKEVQGEHTLYIPKIITLSYEFVTEYTKRFIQSHIDAPLINLYGSTEVGYIYIENEGKLTHCSDFSKVEFIPYCEKKGLYYLIVSSFKNEYMPFIRFKIGDLVKLKSSKTPEIEYICGREKDVVLNEIGDPIAPGEIDRSISHLKNNVLIYQLRISNKHIQFRYVSFDDKSLLAYQENEIKECILNLFGRSYQVQFKLERSISPEVSGKFSIVRTA